MMRSPVVLFAGGGTGGHLLPGVAAAERLRAMAPGARCVFAVTERDREGAWGHGAGERLSLASPRLPRSVGGLASFTSGMLKSIRGTLRELRRLDVDAVVGLGGYGSVGPTVAARLTGRPVVLLEQNVVPGKATRMLARLGVTAAVSFEESARWLASAEVVHTGNPLRRAVLCGARDAAVFGLDPARPVLAVVGGSLGARGLNRRVVAALPRIARAGAQLLWVAGPQDAPAMEAEARAAGVDAAVMAFCDDMGSLYGTADVLLARGGGGTVAEVAARGVPAVFVPYPHHADRQQARNAAALVRRGAARLVEEADLEPERFQVEVLDLLADRERRRTMSQAARVAGRPDAAERVARLVLERAEAARKAI